MSTTKATGLALFILFFFFIAAACSKPLLENTPRLQAEVNTPRVRRGVSINTERQWGGTAGAFGSVRPTAFGRYPANHPANPPSYPASYPANYPAYGGWGSASGSSYPVGGYPSYGGGYGSGYGSGYGYGYDSDYGGYGGFPGYSSYGNYGSYGGNYGGYRPYGGYASGYPPSSGYYDGYYRNAASNN